jgi:hypothetical protein
VQDFAGMSQAVAAAGARGRARKVEIFRDIFYLKMFSVV